MYRFKGSISIKSQLFALEKSSESVMMCHAT